MPEHTLGKQNKAAAALEEIECFVLDMDGTINLGDSVIDGALEFVELLFEAGKACYFFTNNSSRSPQTYVERLRGLGFSRVTRREVMTSGDVMIHLLKEKKENPRVFLSGSPSLERQFLESGIELLEPGCRKADFAVLGFDTTFNYEKADTLCALVAAGVPFLATNIDRVCPLEGGAFMPDCGSMAAMIEHATGIAPEFVGKPFAPTVKYILSQTKTAPERTALVGDRLYTDILTAVNGGIVGIAVLSGEIGWEDIDAWEHLPDYVLGSVRDIYDALRESGADSGRHEP